MFLEETSPKLSKPFEGGEIDFGERIHSKEILPQGREGNQPFSGNKCGHVPSSPREYLRKPHHKRRPFILEEAISALPKAYHNPDEYLTELEKLNRRKKRSERLEAIMSVSQVLFHYLHLETLTVGWIANNGGFVYPELEWISNQAGISYSRTKRAVQDLSKAKYIEITERFKKISIRKISMSFFVDLGIKAKKVRDAINWKLKKYEKSLKTVFYKAIAKARPIKKESVKLTNDVVQKEKAILRKAKELSQQLGCTAFEVLKKLKNSS